MIKPSNFILLFIRLLLINAFLLIFIHQALSQTTGAEGFVLDDLTGKGLPYTNVYFLHTTIGTTTDSTGRFKIKTLKPVDTLVFSQIGYRTVKLGMKPGTVFHLVVRMKDDNITLGQVVIKPGENPAFYIIKQVIRNRKKNDPNRINRFSNETYTNITARLTNINLSDIKSNLLKRLQKYIQHQADNSKLGYIPLYYSEKIANHFVDHKNKLNQTQVIAFNENGIGLLKDFHISTFSGSLNVRMNFYDNYVDLYGHNFVSPVGKLGRQFYKYYLSDSTVQNGQMIYTIKYVPRNDKDLAFRGEFTVVKGLWAVMTLDASLPRVANVNFLNKFEVSYLYQMLDDSIPFFKSSSFKAMFNYNKLPKNSRSMLEVNKYTAYKKIKTGNNAQELTGSSPNKPILSKDKKPVPDTLFSQFRKPDNTTSGTKIIHSIDSINNVGWVRFANKITNMFVTEYYNVGKYEVGPFLNLIQYNRVEGWRLSFGGRTGPLFNPNYTVGAMVGYGFKDKKWKWTTDFTWKLNTEKRTILSLHVSNNLQLWGVYGHIRLIKENVRTVGEDSFISAVFKRAQNERRAMVFQANAYFEHEWKKGFLTSIKLENITIQSNQYVPFVQNGINISSIKDQEATLRLRFSWGERTVDRFVRRYYLGSHYPIISLLGTYGRYEAGNQTGNYLKLHMTVKHRFLIGIPMVRYVIETGILYGKVPFPMLIIQRGNESYGLSRFRFNLLNNASVASDHYLSFMGEVFFNGVIMNRVPLLRKLNLRTVFSTKYLYSQLSNKHEQVVSFPWSMHLPGHQYLEMGVGITNIFKFLRVDYIWRIMPKEFYPMPKNGFRVKIDIDL